MEKNQLEENLDKYFTAVEKVRRQNDRDKEEKLKRLLEPIINLQNDLSTQERRHKFAREDYINLEEEIDLSSLEKKSEDWAILSNWKLGQFGDIDTNDDIITVNYPKFLSEAKNTFSQTEDSMIRTSIRSLYKDWLPQLSQTRIQSKSLLDQILVCYTIKRAQNGDKQASDKLISLYSARAASKETYDNVLKILVWRENNNDVINKFYTNVLKQLTWPEKHKEEEQENKPQDQFYNYDVDDFQQIAKIYLAFIIRGFSPKSILDSIIKEQQSEFLPLPLGIGDVFLYYYGEYLPGIVAKYTTYLNSVRESLKEPGNIHKLIKMAESIVAVTECLNLQQKEDLNVDQLDFLKNNSKLLPSDLVMEVAVSIFPLAMKVSDVFAPFFSTLLDPYTPINSDIALMKNKNAARILNVCYRPQKMGPRNNLTTWLFGGNGRYNLGKLNQMLADYYSRNADDRDTVPLDESPESEFQKDEETLNEYTYAEIHEKKERIDQVVSYKHDLQAIMKKANISEEDYEFLLNHFGGATLEDLAEKYNLTKDQVRYKLKTIQDKLQKTIT